MTRAELDDPTTYSRLDLDDMFRRVNDLAQQMEDAWRIAQSVRLPDTYRQADNVIIAGMGGSAIGGSLLESYGTDHIPVPVTVWRGYGVPASLSDETLFIAVSYSGNTEETLSAVQEARERGAKLLAVTTGGRLGELAGQWHVPTVRFAYDAQPRATLGYLLTPLLSVFGQLGFLPPQDSEVGRAIDTARAASEAFGGRMATEKNLAKQLALYCHTGAAVVYGADYLSAVARRWKTQFNENAKNWAFFEEFSELNHNAIVGYEYPQPFKDLIRVLVLDGSEIHPRLRTRMDVTDRLMDEYGVSYRRVRAEGDGQLAEMVWLIALGDFVTYYLALLNGADPTEIKPIDFLKHQLAQTVG